MALESASAQAEQGLYDLASATGKAGPAVDDLIRSILKESYYINNGINARKAEQDAVSNSEKRFQQVADVSGRLMSTFYSLANSAATVPSSVASSTQAFDAVQPILNTVSNAFQGLMSATGKMIDSFLSWIPAAGQFFKGFIDGLGTASQAVIQFATAGISQQISSTQRLIGNMNQLSAAGLTFGSNLDTARKAAAEGGMSLDTFAKVASKNAENLSLLGKTSEMNAASAVKFSKTLGDLNPGLRTMYGGIEGLSDAVIDFMAGQSRLGVDQQRNQKELTAGAKDYLLNQKELSNLTGKSVEALKKEAEVRAQSAAYQMRLNEMTLTQRQNTETALEQIRTKYGENAYKYAVEYVARGGDVISKQGLQYQSFMGANADAIGKILNSTNQSADAFKKTQADVFQSAAPLIDQQNKSYRNLVELQASGYGPDVLNQINEATASNIKSTNQQKNAVEAQAEATKTISDVNNKFAVTVDNVNISLEGLKAKMEEITTKNLDSTTQIVKLLYKAADAMAEATEKVLSVLKKVLPNEEPAAPAAPRVTAREQERQRRQTEQSRNRLEDQAALDLQTELGRMPSNQEIRDRAARMRSAASTPQAPAGSTVPTPAAPEQQQPATTANVSATPSTVVVGSIDPNAVMTVRAEDLVTAINNLPTREDVDSHNREMIRLLEQIRNQS